jgi:hypothetical protein
MLLEDGTNYNTNAMQRNLDGWSNQIAMMKKSPTIFISWVLMPNLVKPLS